VQDGGKHPPVRTGNGGSDGEAQQRRKRQGTRAGNGRDTKGARQGSQLRWPRGAGKDGNETE
jgi:hypothetical protein